MKKTRYTPEEIADIRSILADYGNIPVAARRVIDQLMGDLQAAHKCLQNAVSIYGKYGMLVNEPGKPGEWIEEAHQVLDKTA